MSALKYSVVSAGGGAGDLSAFVRDDLFIRMPAADCFGTDVYLKLEGLNIAGSIKFKTALAMIEELEAGSAFVSEPGGPPKEIIESSSGNLGVALSLVCAAKGIRFTCVTDPNAAATNLRLMTAMGANVVVITHRDDNGGFLQSRINYIQSRLQKEPQLIWTNQYANAACKRAHKRWTCPAMLSAFPRIDYLFVGVGSSGTLMGCCEYFAEHSPGTRVIGVDSCGSVTFSSVASARHIPGIGSSRRPELFDPALPHRLIQIEETQTIRMCRHVRDHYGLLLGGSTGTVLAAIKQMRRDIPADAMVVALSPDSGDRYVDGVYDDAWVAQRFPNYFDTSPSAAPDAARVESVRL